MAHMFGIDPKLAPNSVNSRFVVFLKTDCILRLDHWLESVEKRKITIEDALEELNEKSGYKKWIRRRMAVYGGLVWCKKRKSFVRPGDELAWCKVQQKWVKRSEVLKEHPRWSDWKKIIPEPSEYKYSEIKKIFSVKTDERKLFKRYIKGCSYIRYNSDTRVFTIMRT